MKKRTIKTLSAASLLIFTAGCQNLYERNESITTFAGDAQAINRANQIEEPWARHSHDTHIHTDGRRAGGAIQRYQNNTVKSDTGITAPTTK